MDPLRQATIRLAHSQPAGSPLRKALLDVLADFDPEEISALESDGALESAPDEPYMRDHFTEQETMELSDRQEAGELSGADPDGPKKYAVELPSEEKGGKDSYDADFKAGFAAGKAAYKKNDQVSASDGEKAYRRVSKKHGSWWEDGYSAAIDLARGADRTKPAQIAKKLGLKFAAASESDEATLRRACIRLAHENEILRPHLLPLLKD